MKKLSIYLSMALAMCGLSAIFSSCNDDKDYPPVIVPENYGSGSWDSPMSVDQVIAGASGTDKWVCGYIVGWVDTNVSNAYSEETVRFTTPCTIASNMVMAASPDERDIEKCIPVQLVSGSDPRKALNLQDNPDVLGKMVSIKGSLERYFGRNAVKSVSLYTFGSQGIYETPSVYSATLSNGNLKDFTFETIAPEDFNVWTLDSKYGLVAKAQNKTADAWAISPMIDLGDYDYVRFTVHNAANYFSTQANFSKMCEVCVRFDENGEWQPVTMPVLPSANSWTFTGSGDIEVGHLSSGTPKKIQIGFHYTSTPSLAGTWEIDEVKVYADTWIADK